MMICLIYIRCRIIIYIIDWLVTNKFNVNKYKMYKQRFLFIVSAYKTLWITILNLAIRRKENGIIMAENEMYNVTVSSFLSIEPAFWNYSDHVILDDLKMDSNFIWLLCSLVSATSWIIYIAYYNSRVTGYILTKLLNRFVIRDGYVKVGKIFVWLLEVLYHVLHYRVLILLLLLLQDLSHWMH